MISIRAEQQGDELGIRSVVTAAFSNHLEGQLVDELRSSGALKISLVALSGQRIVGHVGFSPVTAGSVIGLGLAPLAIDPIFQRQGIGKALVRRGLLICKDLNYPFAVVLGSPDFYKQFGFVAASRWNLRDEYAGGDFFQAIEFQTHAIPRGELIKYGPEFSSFGREDDASA